MVDPASFVVRASDPRPIVVGPWLREVGFEVLYWIPYLRSVLRKFAIPKERVIAISRGGVQPWYSHIADRYLDILDVMSPQEFYDWTSRKNQEGDETPPHIQKAFSVDDFELSVLDRVLRKTEITDYQIIMPSAMYALMRNVWRARFGGKRLETIFSYEPLARPDPVALPFEGPYVAVKFYVSSTFPKGLHGFAQNVVAQLAQRSNVVLLSNTEQLDDHNTFSLRERGAGFEIYDASRLYNPANNLAVQTALVAHAQALHGTYGGIQLSWSSAWKSIRPHTRAAAISRSPTWISLGKHSIGLGVPSLRSSQSGVIRWKLLTPSGRRT